MKRIGNLYANICKLENIISAYDEVCRNTRNKRKVFNFRNYKCIYISRIYNTLINKTYEVGPYNVFTIYEPKKRRIVSQGISDKIVNHLVSRHILIPAIESKLLPCNVASRDGMGTKAGVSFVKEFHRICKIKYGTYYILKCDISKFFASINHDILKKKLLKVIKDKDAISILFKIIDSEENGLGIGNMTSQVLAVFYLNDFDHFVKEVLKIKYYVRYQDDFLLFHNSKHYLKYCLEKITEFLVTENLELNKKTRIYKSTNNFIYLGRDKKGKYVRYRNIGRKLKKRKILYNSGLINLSSLSSTILCYKNLCNIDGSKIIKGGINTAKN